MSVQPSISRCQMITCSYAYLPSFFFVGSSPRHRTQGEIVDSEGGIANYATQNVLTPEQGLVCDVSWGFRGVQQPTVTAAGS